MSKLPALTNLLFRAFVFLLPTQLAYHFWPDWALVFGIRVDYLAPTIYLTDLLFLAVFTLSLLAKEKIFQRNKGVLFWTLLIFVFVFVNIKNAASPFVASIKWIKILEFYLVFLFVRNFNKLDFTKDFLKPLFLSSAFFSLIGVSQFLKGGTLGGPFYFLGERSFNLLTPGISLVKIAGRDFLRAYSTFPHPNSLAGYFSLVLIFYLTAKRKPFPMRLNVTALTLVVVGILLSFSLGAWLGLLFVGLVSLLKTKNPKAILFTAGALSLLILTLPESLSKRIALAEAARKMFSQNPIFGAGLNNFIVDLPKLGYGPDVSWFLQPAHNIYLLALSETGIIGLGLLLLILYRGLKNARERKNPAFFLALCLVALVGTVDHYFLTIQQNLLLFSLILGYSQRENFSRRDDQNFLRRRGKGESGTGGRRLCG